MILSKTKDYEKSAKNLPKKSREILAVQEIFLIENIFHPKLHTKKLKGFPGDLVFSFRITRAYRGIFRVHGENVVLFDVDHRKDIYQSL